jgi:hypothetical protein
MRKKSRYHRCSRFHDGSTGLFVFAIWVWVWLAWVWQFAPPHGIGTVLTGATAAWLTLSVLIWHVRRRILP